MVVRNPRLTNIGSVLESIVVWSRNLRQTRSSPFGDIRLTPSQIDTLFFLSHAVGPVTPSSIACALAVTPGAITQLVDGLRREGLVVTRAHPEDARSRVIALTEAAAFQVAVFEREMTESLAPNFVSLTDGDLAELAELLSRTRRTP